MSSSGCWSCGSLGHHRRACTTDMRSDGAIQTKRSAVKERRMLAPKPEAEKQKWREKQSIRTSPVIHHRDMLRKHLDAELDVIAEVEFGLYYIQKPTLMSHREDLVTATELHQLLKSRLASMRDGIAHSRNYIECYRGTRFWDEEDKMFQLTVNQLFEVRQPLYAKVSKVVAQLKEFGIQGPRLHDFIKEVELDLEVCQSKLGERSPTSEIFESMLTNLETIQKKIADAEHMLNCLQQFSDCRDMETELKELKRRKEVLKEQGSHRVNEEMDSLKTGMLCSICYDHNKEYVLKCGHQYCLRCIEGVKANVPRDDFGRVQSPRCPICKEKLRVLVRVYFN